MLEVRLFQTVNGESYLSKLGLFLILLFATQGIFSQESEQSFLNDDIQQSDILKRFEALENSSISDYLKEMETVNKVAAKYIEKREEECSGVYSTITTNEKGEQIEQKKKLSRKEKRLCKYLLINFQVKVTKISFKLRAAYLKKLSERQIGELEKLSKKRLAELETLAQKYK